MQTLLMMALFVALIGGLFRLYRWRRTRPVLDLGITFMRYRYCLILCCAPGILGAAAWYWPYMLSAILIVRPDFFDLTVVTMICFFTVGVGLAEMQLIRLHGEVRFADRKKLLAESDDPEEKTVSALAYQFTFGKPRKSWTIWGFVAWFSLSLVLPGFCIANAHNDKQPTKVLYVAVVVGTALAILVSLAVAVLQRIVLGGVDETAESGILPFELVVPDRIQPTTKMQAWAVWLFGTKGKGFSKWMSGPGYTDPDTGVLLAGQAQNIILIAFTASVYLANYAYGVWWDTGWKRLDWPIAFYAILLLFLIGFFMTGLAYWLDRFGLPPVVFAAAYVVGCFWIGASDHYFEVDVRPRRLRDHSKEVDSDESNAYVVAARGPALQEYDLEQLYLANVLEEWPFPEIDGKKTLVVVTASGGGMQAAAWTTKVLTELDKELPGFGQSIGLISSVSGGSAGVMDYVGHRGSFTAPLTNEVAESINRSARVPSLEAVSWGLAFPDFVRAVAPAGAPPLTDRGWALESWWWNQMGRPEKDDRQLMQEVTLRDLIPLIKSHKIPPIVFNSTCVETGQRVLISPIHVDVAKQDGSLEWPLVREIKDAAERNRVLESAGHQFVSRPIDFLDFYDACLVGHSRNHPDAWTRSNLRISTATRLSATFSYVTPVARPCPVQDFGLQSLIQRQLARPTNLEKRLHLHFCDGGYADNPGLVTAIRSLKDLMDYYKRSHSIVPFDQVVVVRIEPFPKTAAEVAKDNTGYTSAVYGPTAAMHATRVSTQAERGELEMRLLQACAPDFHKRYVAAKKAIVQLTPAEVRQLKTASADDTAKDPVQRAKARANSFLLQSGVESKEITSMMSEGAPQIESNLDRIHDTEIKNQRSIKGRSVPIISVQFRFELYEAPSDPSASQKSQVVTPPLTWTLTKAQKDDVDRAWDQLRDKSRWERVDQQDAADTISPAEMSRIFGSK